MGKDMQRALLWAILFTSCFLLWDNYQVYKGEKSFSIRRPLNSRPLPTQPLASRLARTLTPRFRPLSPSRILSSLKPIA